MTNYLNCRRFRGFVDAYLSRCYDDGINPAHRLEVCIPNGDEYRDGWLDARATRYTTRQRFFD
jgi:hypothetical protein